jgi:acyl-coenzyme A synthetase/AMP-(fatty) acid ligase
VGYAELPGSGGPPAAVPGDILQLTSGSTGEPRVARQPMANVVHGGRTYRDVFGLRGGDVILAAVPLAHSFGLVGGLAAAVCSGAGLCTLAAFSLRQLRTGLDQGATVMLGTPLVYRLLLPVLPHGYRPPALRMALSSGGPLPARLGADVRSGLGVAVREIYGSTEAGLIAYQTPDGGAMTVAPEVELRLAPTEDGTQLLVRSPSVFRGYAGSGDPPTADGFYDTGDVVTVDGHGRLAVVGSKDTFINVGGRKVNPRRIERILSEYDGVRDLFVYGLDGEEEQRIHAAVVLSPGTGVAEVIEFGRSRQLMPYEVPHRFHVLDRLPRNGMGKVDRHRVIASVSAAERQQ